MRAVRRTIGRALRVGALVVLAAASAQAQCGYDHGAEAERVFGDLYDRRETICSLIGKDTYFSIVGDAYRNISQADGFESEQRFAEAARSALAAELRSPRGEKGDDINIGGTPGGYRGGRNHDLFRSALDEIVADFNAATPVSVDRGQLEDRLKDAGADTDDTTDEIRQRGEQEAEELFADLLGGELASRLDRDPPAGGPSSGMIDSFSQQGEDAFKAAVKEALGWRPDGNHTGYFRDAIESAGGSVGGAPGAEASGDEASDEGADEGPIDDGTPSGPSGDDDDDEDDGDADGDDDLGDTLSECLGTEAYREWEDTTERGMAPGSPPSPCADLSPNRADADGEEGGEPTGYCGIHPSDVSLYRTACNETLFQQGEDALDETCRCLLGRGEDEPAEDAWDTAGDAASDDMISLEELTGEVAGMGFDGEQDCIESLTTEGIEGEAPYSQAAAEALCGQQFGTGDGPGAGYVEGRDAEIDERVVREDDRTATGDLMASADLRSAGLTGSFYRIDSGERLGDVAIAVRSLLCQGSRECEESVPVWGPAGLVQYLAEANGNISNPDLISAGAQLWIPPINCMGSMTGASYGNTDFCDCFHAEDYGEQCETCDDLDAAVVQAQEAEEAHGEAVEATEIDPADVTSPDAYLRTLESARRRARDAEVVREAARAEVLRMEERLGRSCGTAEVPSEEPQVPRGVQ